MAAIIKEKLKSIIEEMQASEAEKLYSYVSKNFLSRNKKITWDEILEEEPDDIDLAMLKDIDENDDCKHFYTEEQSLNQLNS